MLRAVQTLNGSELKAKSMTLPEWYLAVIGKYADKLLKITDTVVADAAFSTSTFVEGLAGMGFHLVSRFRSDAVLYYLDDGPKTGRKGRPKTYDGKVDFDNLDFSRMRRASPTGLSTRPTNLWPTASHSAARCAW